MNRLVILTIVVGLFGCDRKEKAPSEGERGAVKPPPAKAPTPAQDQITLADYIKDKRLYIDLDVGPEAENPFGQFNADGTYQTGAMVGGVAMTSGKPDEKGRYEVSGLTITLSGDDEGEDRVVFSTTEPVGGDEFTMTGEEGEQETVTIVKVEKAGPVAVATDKPEDGLLSKLDPRILEALATGDLKALEDYIEDGGDLNQRDEDSYTPSHDGDCLRACRCGQGSGRRRSEAGPEKQGGRDSSDTGSLFRTNGNGKDSPGKRSGP